MLFLLHRSFQAVQILATCVRYSFPFVRAAGIPLQPLLWYRLHDFFERQNLLFPRVN